MSDVIMKNERVGVVVRSRDGSYELCVDDEVLLTTRVLALATAEYEEEVARRLEPMRRRLDKEKADGAIRAMRTEFFSGQASKAQAKGGSGGRGGV